MLSASIKANVLPIEATAIVNFRVHPRDTVQGVVDYVTTLVGNENVSVSVSGRGGRGASAVSDKDSAGFRLIGQAVQEVYGDLLIVPGLMIAASDSVHYSQIADNSFRFNPMVVTSSDLTGFHGTNEKISVANLVQGTRTYVQVLRHGAH
jgi:carboxypeptidase PM20D1